MSDPKSPLVPLPAGLPEAPLRSKDYWTPERRAEAIETILERIATDTRGIRSICDDDPTLPNVATFFNWKRNDAALDERYARAKEDQADLQIDEMAEIADDGRNDWMERQNEKGDVIGWQVNGEALGRSRLRIDTRKWTAAKLKPKRYGDFSRNEITGPGGGAIQISITEKQAGIA